MDKGQELFPKTIGGSLIIVLNCRSLLLMDELLGCDNANNVVHQWKVATNLNIHAKNLIIYVEMSMKICGIIYCTHSCIFSWKAEE